MFNKRKIRKLKVTLAGLEAELDTWNRIEIASNYTYPSVVARLARKISELKADIKERTAYV